MSVRTAAEYLEAMPHEPAERRKAREEVSARIRGAQWRWKQRLQLRAQSASRRDTNVTIHRGDEVTLVRADPEAEAAANAYVAFFHRFFNDGSFWDLYGASLKESPSPHSRGKMWAKRRRALVSMWVELLVRGEATPKRLAEGDAAAGFVGLSKKHYERLLRERAAADAPPYILDGPAVSSRRRIAKPRDWKPPHAIEGDPKHDEVIAMLDAQVGGYGGLPAIDRPSPLVPNREASTLHPHYVRSLTTLRDDILTRVEPLISDSETRLAAEVLRDDVKFRWWPFRSLHHYISQDVALEWWLDKDDKTRRAMLEKRVKFKFTRATARSLIAAHNRAEHEPKLSNDAIALMLVRDAGSFGWREDVATTARVRVVAAESALALAPLDPRLDTAIHVELAAAHQALGDKKRTTEWLAKAREKLADHPDEWLAKLVEHVAQGQPARIHAQSVGGDPYLEIIALHH